MKTLIAWLALAVILGVINLEILAKERTVRDGQRVLLELGPRDPRSLMQGDYMVLRYRAAEDAERTVQNLPREGKLVLALDADDVGRFVRVHAGEALAANERLLVFRRDTGTVRLGAESWFFEEGQADALAGARYGELRVAADGDSVLIGLRDETFQPLGARPLADNAGGLLIPRF